MPDLDVVEKRSALVVVIPCNEDKTRRLLDLYPLLPHYLFIQPGQTTGLPEHLFRKVYIWHTDEDFDKAWKDMASDVRVFHHAGGV